MENLKEEIRKNPIEFMKNWMNGILKHTGEKVMPYLSIIPCSMILPNISLDASEVRMPLNLLLIAPPSSGKSALISKFKEFAYYPVEVRDTTPAGIRTEILKKGNEIGDDYILFTILIEDIAVVADNYITIKFLEGAVGDEQRININRRTGTIFRNTRAGSFICATPEDTIKYIEQMHSGFFSRVIPLIIYTNDEEHSDIGKHITDNMGIKNKDKKSYESIIKEFYSELYEIQNGKHEIPQIVGYDIRKSYKDDIFKAWDSLSKRVTQEFSHMNHNFFRELHEAFRFMIAHAFINIFNREHKDGILVPNDDDFNFAMEMMTKNIKFKYSLLRANKWINDKKNLNDLMVILQESNLDEDDKNMLRILASSRAKRTQRLNFS